MFKNRLILIVSVLAVLLVTMAISRPFSSIPMAENSSWPPRPVIVAVTGADNFSDYHQRHSELRSSAERSQAAEIARWEAMGEYYQKLAEAQNPQRGRAADAARWTAMADYYQHHSGMRDATISPIDECFDVSLSEVAACREASQSPAQ